MNKEQEIEYLKNKINQISQENQHLQRQIDAIFNTVPFSMWIKDVDGKILKVNEKYVESCGKSKEEIIGKTDYDIFSIEVAEQYVTEDRQTIAKNKQHVLYKKDKSGNEYNELEIRKSPIYDKHQQVVETIGMAIDASNLDETSQELKASRERIYRMYQDSVLGLFRLTKTGKLIETNAAFIQMFGYNSLSELKSSIQNFFSDLHISHENENQLKKVLFVENKDSCKCDELFKRKDQSFFHGSVFARKVYCKEIKDICIEGYIEDISERKKIEFEINNKKIHVISDIQTKELLIADENMIKTVLRNLMSNAIKFTEKEGQITISARKGKDTFHIAISDTGIGIPKDILPKLFRIENSFTTQGTKSEKGTGIGLILCKEFVEKNKGTIRVESTENIGTTFYLEFMQ